MVDQARDSTATTAALTQDMTTLKEADDETGTVPFAGSVNYVRVMPCNCCYR